jgi:hypothetical protein
VAAALELRVYSPTAHLRMTNFPAAPQVNPTFLNPTGNSATRLDLSGIGWSAQDPTKQLTLVSPRHFVGANHFRPAIGSTVRFLGTDHSLYTLTVSSITALPNENNSPSDLYLAEFTSELPASAPVLPLPYLNLATEAAYVGQNIIVAGQAARGGRGVIGSVTDFGKDPITGGANIQTRAFTFSYAPAGSVDDAYAQVGDSGSPSLAVRDGKAALVGTHTAVLSASSTITTYDTLVPHYAPEIDALMGTTGLRLKKINPPIATLTVTGAAMDPMIRTGEAFTYRFTINNTSAVEADNVSARFATPPGLTPSEVIATGWRDNADSSVRRAGLAASGAASFDITFAAAPPPGTLQLSLAVKSDGSPPQSKDFSILIHPSYAEWIGGIAASGFTDDSDADGIPNLIEYACGGDNQTASRYLPGTTEFLTPQFITYPATFTFIRRTDSSLRGLRYYIEYSTDLKSASWQTLENPEITSLSFPASGFEKAAARLPTGAPDHGFYRLRIELAE